MYRLWSLRARRVVGEQADDEAMKSAGLDEPEITIALRGKQGAEFGTFAFTKVVSGERFATAVGSGRIDAVDSTPIDETSFSPEDYREEHLE